MKRNLVFFLEVLHFDPHQPLLCHHRPHGPSPAPSTEQGICRPMTAPINATDVSLSSKWMLCHNPPVLLLLSHPSPLHWFPLALLTFHGFLSSILQISSSWSIPAMTLSFPPFKALPPVPLSLICRNDATIFLLLNYFHSQSFHLLQHIKYALAENRTGTPHHEPFKRDAVIAEPALNNLSRFLLLLLSPSFSLSRGSLGFLEK